MRCRVCGYEVGPDATHCPMCGSRVASGKTGADGELSWNTKDFPKPREMEDIKMDWPDINAHRHGEEAVAEKKEPVAVMSGDASEGYVSIPEEKPAFKAEEKPAPKAEDKPAPKAEDKPAEKEAAEPFWITQKFTATGIMKTAPVGGGSAAYPAKTTIESVTFSDTRDEDDDLNIESFVGKNTGERFPMLDTLAQKNAEFQKLLDMEYDRLHAMHGEDAVKELEDSRFIPDQSVKAKDLSTFEKMLMEAASVPVEETPAQKFFRKPTEEEKAATDKDLEEFIAPSGDPANYDINTIENTIRELKEEEARAEKRRTERQKRLDTMAAAREAYFKSLDEAQAKAAKKSAKPAEPAPAPAAAAVVADASPIDLWDNNEPTKEIPVGSILKALAAGGALAAVEKSVEEAVNAPAEDAAKAIEEAAAARAAEEAAAAARAAEEAAAAKAAEEAEKLAAEPVHAAAAMAVQPIASIRQDLEQTKVFRRSLTEEAEERARLYEDGADGAADLARRYEEDTEDKAEVKAEDKAEEKAAEAASAIAEEKAADSEEICSRIAAAVAAAVADKEAAEAEDRLAEAAAKIEQQLARGLDASGKAEEKATEVLDAADDKDRIAAALAAATAAAAAKAGDASDAQDIDFRQDGEDEEGRQAADVADAQQAGVQSGADQLAADQKDAAEDKEDALSAAFAGKEVAEPTHEFDLTDAQDNKEEKKEEDKEDAEDIVEETKSKHVFLKIIAVILIICAIFEAAVWGLKQFAPDWQITENAIQIEKGIGDALLSFYNTVANWIKGITGSN